MTNKILYLLFFVASTALSGCSLLKRDRVSRHKGIERSDFDLPTFVYPAADHHKNETLLVFLSGDGGWLEFEDTLSVQFANEGYHTIGFNSRDYFWEQRTPRRTAEDLSALLHIYVTQYKPDQIILCGYSFGADVIPFIYNRLSPRLKRKITILAMMSPFATTDFMVHTSDLLNIAKDNKAYNIRAEIDQISIPILCFYGQDENPKAQEGVKKQNFQLKLLPGNHHYDEAAYKEIITIINKAKNKTLNHRTNNKRVQLVPFRNPL